MFEHIFLKLHICDNAYTSPTFSFGKHKDEYRNKLNDCH